MAAEKKQLHPAIACGLMVVMLVCALLLGANRAWKTEDSTLVSARTALQETFQARIETANNLITVARRYLDSNDVNITAVQNDIVSMQNGKSTLDAVSAKQYQEDMENLLSKLAQMDKVKADSRDTMYVTQMLPQALELCIGTGAETAYNEAAQARNDNLNSFSGFLARLTGVSYTKLISAD